MSFFVEWVGRMPRRCAATTPFEGKTSPCSVFSFVAVEAAVWRMGFQCDRLVWVHSIQMSRLQKSPSILVRLVFRRVEGVVVSSSVWLLPTFNRTHVRRRR